MNEIGTVEAGILNIEEQVLRIEGGATVADVYEALKLAGDTMKVVNKKVNPDDLAELMGELQDINADMDEVNDILGETRNDVLDDADLLAEFEKLGQDKIEEDAFGEIAAVPSKDMATEDAEFKALLRQDSVDIAELEKLVAPKHTPKKKEDDEIAALEKEMFAVPS